MERRSPTSRRCTGLRELYLNLPAITDLAPLSKLVELRVLKLSSTRVRDLSPLAGLRELNLWLTVVSDLSPLAHLTGLRASCF
jgi:Leucine-rich repeat (LRR) protein